jgi:hypothetical protein
MGSVSTTVINVDEHRRFYLDKNSPILDSKCAVKAFHGE